MSALDELVREFGRLPGVGPRTATRLVYHLLRGRREDAHRLAGAIEALLERVRPCSRCGTFAEADLCEVCRDPSRERSLVCVVEGAFEVQSIEKTRRYRGLYHVLGGRLSPLDGVGPDDLAVAALAERIESGQEGIVEVILATSPSVEGEATAVYLEGVLRPLGVRVTRLARGIPVGSDLEYVDGSTLAEALAGRREVRAETPAQAVGADHEDMLLRE
ncbi:MAG: recombination protein RecR [Gemmatimonadales bacterium]|nr:MAG: recombination protein RecR [Gemmatimonadales bacterium]